MLLTQEQYLQLLALLKIASLTLKTFNPSANNVQTMLMSSSADHKISGISLCKLSDIPCILDIGATDRTIYSKSLFHSIQASISSSVVLPNGNVVLVTYIGTTEVTKSLTLGDVLLTFLLT